MITQDKVHSLYGLDVYDNDGDRIGTVGAVWTDGAGRPVWASARTGLFGLNESLFPLQNAELRGDNVVVPFDKATVKDAPNVDADHDEPLDRDEVRRLYEHYGFRWEDGHHGFADGGRDYADHDWEAAGHGGDTRGAVDAGDGAMTRSEERLNVGTERERVGRARLRKYVVTEPEQVSVPVSREEVRLEREPITDRNRDAAYSGPDLTESEHEVTLHAERPVVGTETVPVERVRLGKETVTEQQEVGRHVRKERIEADLPGEQDRTVG
ncbi:hypothetical protein AMIS_47300 [Actinoplanes missouriensis 431]|uniref:DUF2382 domain-containing protein n=1 Tax=Actinoplanes missouriensis (strain ATCC 14538 / DSM 43046 / CBS 188.64 / JCM 3121 / NBRC 102363 / NCIMB 12654 / NRRL B-3342 / UNCC 431) TaxID=512565 RepID=I0HAB3_ACTM4|nr:PRC and DUF2382 domain-containing protein [Actinoplanes missouriensis]BAL89950.1 hypothetical protein AMIS_47300 [Actinoplanes missouriensis 431]